MFENTETHAVYKRPSLNFNSKRVELPLGLFRIGRDTQNNLVLEDSALSRHHFAIDVQAHQAQLIDLGSANGTYVNKKRVRGAWLQDGDKIKVGDEVLTFEAPGFVLGQALFDDAESTSADFEDAKSTNGFSWLALWALLVASSSLFVQVLNYETQAVQSSEIVLIRESVLRDSIRAELIKNNPLNTPEKRWHKALSDYKSGDEDQACHRIKSLIPELKPKELLREKAQSFFERKCTL